MKMMISDYNNEEFAIQELNFTDYTKVEEFIFQLVRRFCITKVDDIRLEQSIMTRCRL